MMPADTPNILIIMYDQLNPTMLGCYGHPVTLAPTIDALAERGVVFESAYSNSPLCTPARYAMMTGQLPSTTNGFDNAAYLASSIPTFAHYARGAGYHTMLSGKMHFVGADQLHGFESRRTTDIYPADFGWTPNWHAPDERIDWWYHNMDSVTGAGVAEVTNQLLYDDEVGHQAVRGLHDLVRGDRPFLLVASFTHPHDPYVTRRQYWDLYEGAEIPMPRRGIADVIDDPHSVRLRGAIDQAAATVTDDHVRAARRAYMGNISYVDHWTARLVDTLDALEVADNTIVMLVADHGDMLGERGLWYKMSFFEGSARVPLVIHAPHRFAPQRIDAPVSLVDVLPTIVELVGGQQPVGPVVGASLVGMCAGTDDGSQRAVIGEYMAEGSVAPIVMIRRGSMKFVHCPADPDQLYDIATDPDEVDNLAGNATHAATVADFRAEVARRWDIDQITAAVIADQDRRRLVGDALRVGRHSPWEYAPPQHAESAYMRNHLDLNEVERSARWPRR